ncbi:MAG TPA: M13 family metallopeptidase [Gemmatimonadaceae bacterium]|jgi:putative endopeptidase
MRVYLIVIFLLTAIAKLPAQQPGTRIDPANFDTTCGACTDFYRYANGGWIARTAVPPAQPKWSAFAEVTERVDSTLSTILAEASRDRSARRGSPMQLIGAYYRSCMDTSGANAQGIASLVPLLAPLDSIRRVSDVARAISRLQGLSVGVVFSFDGGQDAKDATRMIAVVSQAGLGMPTRDYYLRTDSRTREVRQAYDEYLRELFVRAGDSPGEARDEAARDMLLEGSLAAVSLSPEQSRDPSATYHRMSVGELQRMTPHFAWKQQFAMTDAPRITVVDVEEPGFLRGVDSLIADAPLAEWRSYLRAAVLSTLAPTLDSGFVSADFRYHRHLTGASTQLAHEKLCVSSIKGRLGELVGHEYVKRAFTPAAKQRALELVTNLKAALHDRIAALDWMSETTKREALAKLAAIRIKVGYPDVWHDYSSLALHDTSFVANFLAVRQWSLHQELSRVGKRVNRELWSVAPHQVDAFALSTDIVFPAGILQPPIYDPSADDAVNYGAIGSMIGHEMTHHFDDRGRHADAAGNLRDWWTPDDAARYQARAERVVDQFNAYTIVDSATHVNGRLTLSENIADLGGVKISFLALERLLARKGRPQAIDGFTPEQRFFLAYARMWRAVTRPEYARTSVNTDPHSPSMWRVNGPLSNMPEFAAAWGCREGDPMVRPPQQRAAIW